MKNNELFQPLLQGAIVALGFLAAWVVVGVVVLESGMILTPKRADHLSILADGTVLLRHWQEGEHTNRDLDGHTVVVPDDDPNVWLNRRELPSSLPWRKEDGDWDQRVRGFSDGRSRETAWYFITDGKPNGSAYFVGYDSYSKEKIGYLGVAGFRTELPPDEERFPFAGATSGRDRRLFSPGQVVGRRSVSVHNGGYSIESNIAFPSIVYFLGDNQTIYETDLRNRTVRTAFRERAIRSMSLIGDMKDGLGVNWLLTVRTDGAVLVLDKHGAERRRYPIPPELREKSFEFGEATTGEAIMSWLNEREDIMDTQEQHQVIWVRDHGQNRTANVTLPFDSGMRSLRFYAAALFPSPLALNAAGIDRSRDLIASGSETTIFSALGRTLRQFWPAAVLAHFLAACLAVLCYRRQVRYGLGRGERIAWPLFVLFLGLPGWIGYRFGRKWPVLEVCPDCGIAVPRDRESCVCCTNEFPRPVLKGTEVFA